MKGPLPNIVTRLIPPGRLPDIFRIYILANVSCLLFLAVLSRPVIRRSHEGDDSRKVVIASRIAEEVVREIGSQGAVGGDIPTAILSRYEELSPPGARFTAGARMIKGRSGEEAKVEVTVSWDSAEGPKRIRLVKELDEDRAIPEAWIPRPRPTAVRLP